MNSGAKTTATIAISLIRMLSAGPAVSLNGSPIVSPMTVWQVPDHARIMNRDMGGYCGNRACRKKS